MARYDCISLTTDYGLSDGFVAACHGVLARLAPHARVIDVTHLVPPGEVAQGANVLAQTVPHLPTAVHVAVVDPGVGTKRDIVAVVANGHAFLAPDNGLLAPIVTQVPTAKIHRFDAAGAAGKFKLPPASATFHGRDIFAPLAAEIAGRRASPADLGPRTHDIVPSWVDEPSVAADQVAGVVMTTDHFGNLITNIDGALIESFRRPMVKTGGHSFALRRTYGDVSPGEFLALVNSFGVVEIARAEQSAAEALGLGRGAPVTISSR